MRVKILQAVHAVVVVGSLVCAVIVATRWRNPWEAAVAFLLLSAKVNAWTNPQDPCVLTRLEAVWANNPNIKPFVTRILRIP